MVVLRHAIAGIALASSVWAAGGAMADEQPVVVELFTSQGCSSCPPADAMLGELAQRRDVIALALHVDYWDYIGWADTFAQAAFTQRQHDYARVTGSSVVYTPQIVIGGTDHVVGPRQMEVAELIAAHNELPDPVHLAIRPEGEGWFVQAEWRGRNAPTAMVVQLVGFEPHQRVEITQGENAGLTGDYYNVVTQWRDVASWPGATPLALRVAATPASDHAVIIQGANAGPIMAAARLE